MKNGKARERVEDIFTIDPAKLPEEWLEQPGLYNRWATKAVTAREARDRAKAEMDLVEAEVAVRVRKRPLKFGFKSVTEATIKEVVKSSAEYQSAQRLYLSARADADYAEVAVQTLEHRKRALEKLADLALANFFSVPRSKSVSDDVKDGWQETRKRKVRSVD